MKPDYLPIYRDGGRLLVTDLAEFTKSRAARERRFAHPHGKQAMRLLAWPNAKWWRAHVIDVETLPFESRHPQRDEAVLAAWARLGKWQRWDVASVADALLLLVETPAVETFGGFDEREIDPRRWLGDRARLREWLLQEVHLWESAIHRLLADGRLSEEAARRLLRHRPKAERCPDPHALVHFGFTGDLGLVRWEERVVRSTLAFFRGGSLRQVRAATSLIEAMTGGDGRHVTLVQRFLAENSFASNAPWLSLISVVRRPERRLHFLERLAAREAKSKVPRGIAVSLIQKIEQRARRHRRDCLELAGVFTVVERGLDPAVLEDGIALAERFPGADLEIDVPTTVGRRSETARFVELAERVSLTRRKRCHCGHCSGGRRILRLWHLSLNSAELRREISAGSWRAFPEVAGSDWLQILLNVARLKLTPRVIRGLFERLRRSIAREPESRRRLKASVWEQLTRYASNDPSDPVFDDFETLAATAAEGFKKHPSDGISLLDDLYRVATRDQRWSLANVPRSVLNHFEEAARSYQESEQIQKGGAIWLRALPEEDLALLFRRPKRFLDALRNLGTLPENEAVIVCGNLRYHPGFGIDPRRIDLREACFLFDTILRDGETDPVPNKLRDAACGRIILSTDAMRHYRDAFADQLADYQIDRLFERIRAVEERFRREGLDPHTVRFLAGLGKSNRRVLKRFLHSIREGRGDYRESHPANLAWLAKHAHLSFGEWLQGGSNAHPVALPGHEGAFVRLEDDPQEALKMGTYADTCLAIGGCNQHAAVANALDVNKRVAYLRDREGRPLARQLLAISEEETLVPFSVYRIESTVDLKEVKRIFREFDDALAGRLGLPRWKDGSEYRIPALVARDWYDDRAWTAGE